MPSYGQLDHPAHVLVIRLTNAVRKRQTAYGHALKRLEKAQAHLSRKEQDLQDYTELLRKAKEAQALSKTTPEMECLQKQARILESLTPNKIAQFKCMYNEGGPDECWPWLGEQPKMQVGGKNLTARRIAWAFYKGTPLPYKHNVYQKNSCGPAICVNPAHLSTATISEIARRQEFKYQNNGRPRNHELYEYETVTCPKCGEPCQQTVGSSTSACAKCLRIRKEAREKEVENG